VPGVQLIGEKTNKGGKGRKPAETKLAWVFALFKLIRKIMSFNSVDTVSEGVARLTEVHSVTSHSPWICQFSALTFNGCQVLVILRTVVEGKMVVG